MRARWWTMLLLVGACTEVVFSGDDGFAETDLPDVENPRGDDVEVPIAVCQAQPNPAGPGEKVDLIGENSRDPDGSEIINYRWDLLHQPEGSNADLPRGQANLLDFRPDVLGAYTATLVVTDDRGKVSNPCTVELDVVPSQDLYIEVVASTDQDQIRPVLHRGGDWDADTTEHCKPSACDVDWGADGKDAADPKAREGEGEPSVISIADPAEGVYTLRVHDEATIPPGYLSKTEIVVRVFVKGVEKYTTTFGLEFEGDEVAVATINWPSGKVEPIGE